MGAAAAGSGQRAPRPLCAAQINKCVDFYTVMPASGRGLARSRASSILVKCYRKLSISICNTTYLHQSYFSREYLLICKYLHGNWQPYYNV